MESTMNKRKAIKKITSMDLENSYKKKKSKKLANILLNVAQKDIPDVLHSLPINNAPQIQLDVLSCYKEAFSKISRRCSESDKVIYEQCIQRIKRLNTQLDNDELSTEQRNSIEDTLTKTLSLLESVSAESKRLLAKMVVAGVVLLILILVFNVFVKSVSSSTSDGNL